MPLDLTTTIAGIRLNNPILVASGTFSYGQEFAEFYDLSLLGGLITKTITLEPRQGNPPPRVTETAAGMLNSIGLANPGVDGFLKDKLPQLKDVGCPIIVNIAGRTVPEYAQVAAMVSDSDGIAALELNVSCPNVKEGGIQFGTDETMLAGVVRDVKAATHLPVIVKLSPNVTDIARMAIAAQDGGADAVSLINTLIGMAVDAQSRKPIIGAVTGGLSGPAIKPVALAMVWKVANAAQIPIIGIGGIMTGQDAAEFMIAGASAVQVGTANFVDPHSAPRILSELTDFLGEQNLASPSDLVATIRTLRVVSGGR